MVAPVVVAGLIAAGASILSGIVDYYGSKDVTAEQNANTYKMNMDMLKYQNEYNLPTNQMARLRDAGLNPNLVYGNGTVQGLTSASAPSMSASQRQAYSIDKILGALDMAMKSSQIETQQAITEKTKSENEEIITRRALESQEMNNLMENQHLIRRQIERLGLENHLLNNDVDIITGKKIGILSSEDKNSRDFKLAFGNKAGTYYNALAPIAKTLVNAFGFGAGSKIIGNMLSKRSY